MKKETAHSQSKAAFSETFADLQQGVLDSNTQVCRILLLYVDYMLEKPKNQKIHQQVRDSQKESHH